MSRRPIDRSLDLQRLQNEGYDIEVRHGFLLIRDVPYAASNQEVQRGVLISKLELSDDKTNTPQDHVAYWTGSHPCHADGRKISSIENGSPRQDFGNGIVADFTFSAKGAYRDYHHKMTTYIGRITGEARVLDPNVTAQTFPVIKNEDPVSPFKYVDTATSRAGIGAVNCKLLGKKIGVLGLGGSGSYILDLVSKTCVAEIRAIDGDVFSQHNAFRSPGAASAEQLQGKPPKVLYYNSMYSNIRDGLVIHNAYMDETNLHLLDDLDFVFLSMDIGPAKRLVVQHLVTKGTSFIDTGMGVLLEGEKLGGIVRVTTSTPETREEAAPHISYSDDDGGLNEYASNIQTPELNALNAAMAVIRWKKLFGIYDDARGSHYEGYSIRSGEIVAEQRR